EIGLMSNSRNERDSARRRGAGDDLLIEAPQILERTAAAGDDQDIWPRWIPSGRKRIETSNGGGDFGSASLPLHPHRPYEHVAWKAVGEPMDDVADDGTRRRGDDANDAWEKRQRLLARRLEQAFSGELFLSLLQKRHERASAGRLDLLDDELIFRLRRIG